VRCRASSGPILSASRNHADARSVSIIRPTRAQSRRRRSVPQLETDSAHTLIPVSAIQASGYAR
jgi:hypothetical protein